MRATHWIPLLALAFVLPGCTTAVKRPEIALPSQERAEQAWSHVLARVVDDRGRVDYASLSSNHDELDTYVRYVSAISPESQPEQFKDRSVRIAYEINSYNALAMYHVLTAGVPQSLSGFHGLDFFVLTALDIGGHYLSLYRYENEFIRPLGEERVHFALNCMVRGCPLLPREPFRAETLDSQLDTAAKRFLNEERNVQIVPASGKVRVSAILKFYTRDFLAKAPSLIAYINRYRLPANRIPESDTVEFMDYDWTINAQPPVLKE